VGEKPTWGTPIMSRVLISVEGQTEETFVREILSPHLLGFDVYLTPVLLTTKFVKSGPNFKGGLTSYDQARREILRLLNDRDAVAVTTMYDLYGLPNDFPGYDTRPMGNCYAKVAHLEQALQQDINNRRFLAYLQLHEFEALMYVEPDIFSSLFPGSDQVNRIRRIRQDFNSPEEIDDGPQTAPSKRILALYPEYEKPLHGPLATIDIGLDAILRECPHLRQWIEWLQGLENP
jgi:hypothetical protein